MPIGTVRNSTSRKEILEINPEVFFGSLQSEIISIFALWCKKRKQEIDLNSFYNHLSSGVEALYNQLNKLDDLQFVCRR